MFLGTLVYGFINSVILALVALGFNLTFGISGVANFAYGAIYIFAGFAAWTFFHTLALPYILAAVLSIICSAALGALMYRFVLLRLRGMVVSEVIATFAIGLAILEAFRYLGFIGFKYTLPVFWDGSVEFWGVYVDYQRLAIVAIGLLLTVALYLFIHHTRIGLAFRGIAQDEETALSLGIHSDWIASLSLAFGSGLAAIAAVAILPLGTISVGGGYDVLVNALAVCIVGGLGSAIGVVLASFLIGYAQMITSTYFGASWVMLISLVAILIILVVRPSGLFGKQKELEERI